MDKVDTLNEWLTVSFAGNELWRLAVLFLTVFIALVAGRVLRFVLQRYAGRLLDGDRKIKAAFVDSIARIAVMLLFLMGVNLGVTFLVLNETLMGLLQTCLDVLLTVVVAYALYCFVDVVDKSLAHLAANSENTFDDMLVPMVRKSLRVTIVLLAAVQIAQILSGKPLSSIIAALGIGGAALALASRDTVANFFGSLVIFTDRPFKMGDLLLVDGITGSVEEVGFRSTRLRTLDSHLVVIPNGELANKTITNITARPHIKRVMNLTVTYDTSPEKMRRAKEILEDILRDHEGMDPDLPPRVYFSDFNDWALNILVLYWFSPPDYWQYCAFNEKVNLEILTRFNAEGIDFAFPSQTIYHAGDDARPVTIGVHNKSSAKQ